MNIHLACFQGDFQTVVGRTILELDLGLNSGFKNNGHNNNIIHSLTVMHQALSKHLKTLFYLIFIAFV